MNVPPVFNDSVTDAPDATEIGAVVVAPLSATRVVPSFIVTPRPSVTSGSSSVELLKMLGSGRSMTSQFPGPPGWPAAGPRVHLPVAGVVVGHRQHHFPKAADDSVAPSPAGVNIGRARRQESECRC